MAELKIQEKYAALTFVNEAAFETDPGSHSTLRLAHNIKGKLDQAMASVAPMKSAAMAGPDPSVAMGKGGKLTFDIYLHTLGGAESPIVSLAKNMGCSLLQIAEKSAAVTGGSANTIAVADADATGLVVGAMVEHVPASGTTSCRFITRVVSAAGTTTCTVNQDFDTSPSAGDTIGATDTLIPAGSDPSATMAMALYLGQDAASKRRKLSLVGCAGTFKVEAAGPKDLIKVTFDIAVSSWSTSDTGLAQADASGNRPMTPLGGSMLIDGTAVKTPRIAFDPGITVEEIQSFDANGRQGYNYSDGDPVLEFLPLFDADYLTKWVAETTFDWMYSRVVAADDAFGIWCPKVQIVDHDFEPNANLLRSKMSFLVCDAETNADSTKIPRWAIGFTK